MILALGALIIAAVVWAIVRGIDVRLALFLGGLALGVLTGQPAVIVRKFLTTMVAEEFVITICASMGFAYVLRHTECDRHLVQLLVQPLRRARPLLIPGAILVGFVVNIPIISQTSAAATIGPVVIPLMMAAGLSPITAGSTLLLGTSVGGALLNPGAPEFRTVVREAGLLGHTLNAADCVRAVLPLNLVQLGVAALVFWGATLRKESQRKAEPGPQADPTPEAAVPRISYAKAMVPLVPLALLFMAAPPLELIHVPRHWLVGPREPGPLLKEAGGLLKEPRFADAAPNPFDSRLIGAAMLIGVAAAAMADRKAALGVFGPFFAGAGFAFTQIISIIVTAACFGEGVKLLGLDRLINGLVTYLPQVLVPMAGVIPFPLALLSGSGMAATQSLFGLFAGPSLSLDIAPQHVGAVVSLSAAAGRTMSPVAAVTIMCASLTGTQPAELVRRVAVPLILGIVAMTALGSLATGGFVR